MKIILEIIEQSRRKAGMNSGSNHKVFSVLSDEKYMILSESNENVIFLNHIQKETKYNMYM